MAACESRAIAIGLPKKKIETGSARRRSERRPDLTVVIAPSFGPAVSMSRLQEVYNFRDLGGQRTSEGKSRKLRSGVLFRSANTSFATQADVKTISESLGVRTILDFRKRSDPSYTSAPNRLNGLYPDKTAGDTKRGRVWISYVSKGVEKELHRVAPTSAVLSVVFWKIMRKLVHIWQWFITALLCWSPPGAIQRFFDWADMVTLCRYYNAAFLGMGGMPVLYKIMLAHAGERIASALKICATKSQQPVLFHCASGKDRAGLTAFLLLRACGVSVKDCVEDYHRSDAWGVSKEHYNQISGGKGPAFIAHLTPALISALRAPKAYIQEANEFIEKEFGGVEKYLDKIGFDESWRKKLRSVMLE